MNNPVTSGNGGMDPLAALHPLREPAAIGWWPPAPGWWILAALVLVSIAVLVTVLWRRRRREAYRRRASAALARIREEYANTQDAHSCLAHTNALLKSVALIAFPRRDVAAMSGERWQAFLNETVDEAVFDHALLVAQYRPQPPGEEVQRQLDAAALWLRKHRRPA